MPQDRYAQLVGNLKIDQKALAKAWGLWVIVHVVKCQVFPTHLINLQVFIKLPLSASTKDSCHSLVPFGFAAESLRKWRGS